MKSSIITFIFTIIFATSALAKPKVVTTAKNFYINEFENSASIGFSRLVFNVPDTNYLGRAGLKNSLFGCTNRYDFEVDGNNFTVSNPGFETKFTEIMKAANYRIPGNQNALFEEKGEEAEFLIAAMITNFEIDFCQREVGTSGDGQLYMEVSWQVFNIAKGEIVFEAVSEGYHKIKKEVDNIFPKLSEATFASALYNLIETDDLAIVLAQEDRMAVDPEFDGVDVGYKEVDPTTEAITLVEARQSVVTVKAPTGGHGTGFFVSDNGYLLTNEHVVGTNDVAYVLFDNGVELEAQVVRVAPVRDVALLKLPISKSNSLILRPNEPDIGTSVYAIGSPLSTGLSGTVSQGIISGYRLMDDLEFIQSDAQINPGNSGGPLIGEDGHAVGIAVSGRMDGEGINFFIPIKFALEALNITANDQPKSKYINANN